MELQDSAHKNQLGAGGRCSCIILRLQEASRRFVRLPTILCSHSKCSGCGICIIIGYFYIRKTLSGQVNSVTVAQVLWKEKGAGVSHARLLVTGASGCLAGERRRADVLLVLRIECIGFHFWERLDTGISWLARSIASRPGPIGVSVCESNFHKRDAEAAGRRLEAGPPRARV